MDRLCPQCFHNKGLRARLVEIRPQVSEGRCDNHPSRKGIPIENVAEIIDEVFRNNFSHGATDTHYLDDPMEMEPEYTQRGRPFREIVGQLIDAINGDIVDALSDTLMSYDVELSDPEEYGFYDDIFRYEEITHGDGDYSASWERFCSTILHEQRFFNKRAGELLNKLFENIHLQKDIHGRYPAYLMEPQGDRIIYRARIPSAGELDDILADPAVQMGAPPIDKAKPNRMNPSGIIALYGSFEQATCVAELRPAVGSQVVIAQMRLRRELCVLDMTRFSEPPRALNLFNKDHIRRLAQWHFLQRFRVEIAKPIKPDAEHLDYVPTQAVAEYLSKVFTVRMGKERRPIDAVIFQSAQRPQGSNIVLLGDAAQIESARTTKRSAPSLMPSLNIALFEERETAEPGLILIENGLSIQEVSAASYAVAPVAS